MIKLEKYQFFKKFFYQEIRLSQYRKNCKNVVSDIGIKKVSQSFKINKIRTLT